MNSIATNYYYVRYDGQQGKYLTFGIGIDEDEVNFEYLIDSQNDMFDGDLVWVYQTRPNRTDNNFTEEHQKMFDIVAAFIRTDFSEFLVAPKKSKRYYVNIN